MKYIEPQFYEKFKCTASDCSRNCCIGWEIDIDKATAYSYRSMRGKVGRRLRNSILWGDQPHFILAENERCPFLTGDNLCELVIQLGEGALCDICREHPRFYNCTAGREEAGLGLCCEEAVRLLLSENGKLEFKVSDDGGDEEDTPQEEKLYEMRQKIMDIISAPGGELLTKMADAASLCGRALPKFDMPRWGSFYLTLERLDEGWTAALDRLVQKGAGVDMRSALNDEAYERIAEYFIYRHFAAAGDMERSGDMLLFCFVSTALVCCLDSLGGDRIADICMYSSEIEYSDENIGRIVEEIRARI